MLRPPRANVVLSRTDSRDLEIGVDIIEVSFMGILGFLINISIVIFGDIRAS